MTLSLCLVLRNALPQLQKILNHTEDIVDEVVVFDQSSDDGTEDFCRGLPNCIYVKTSRKNLADLDRYDCYMMATGNIVLALDWDELPDERLMKYIAEQKKQPEYEVWWIPFRNFVKHKNRKHDISNILGRDWHPRMWLNDQSRPPVIVWPKVAHTFPNINTPRWIFLERGHIIHERTLEQIKKTSEDRRKVIDPANQQKELNFIEAVERTVGTKK